MALIFPDSPKNGDVYRSSDTSRYVFEEGTNGGAWRLITSPFTYNPSDTEPDTGFAEEGDLWVNTSACPPELFVYTECQEPYGWQPIGGSGGAGGGYYDPTLGDLNVTNGQRLADSYSYKPGDSAQTFEQITISASAANAYKPVLIRVIEGGERFKSQTVILDSEGNASFRLNYLDDPETPKGSGTKYESKYSIGSEVEVFWGVQQFANFTEILGGDGSTAGPNASPSSVDFDADAKYGTGTASWADGNTTLKVEAIQLEGSVRKDIFFSVNDGVMDQSDKTIENGDILKVSFDAIEVDSASDGDLLGGILTDGGNFYQLISMRRRTQSSDFTISSLFNQPTNSPVITGNRPVFGVNAKSQINLVTTGAGTEMTDVGISVNGDPNYITTFPVEFNPGDSLRVKATTGGIGGETYTATFDIGGTESTWSVTTGVGGGRIAQPQIVLPATETLGLQPDVILESDQYRSVDPNTPAGTFASSSWEVYEAGRYNSLRGDMIIEAAVYEPLVIKVNSTNELDRLVDGDTIDMVDGRGDKATYIPTTTKIKTVDRIAGIFHTGILRETECGYTEEDVWNVFDSQMSLPTFRDENAIDLQRFATTIYPIMVDEINGIDVERSPKIYQDGEIHVVSGSKVEVLVSRTEIYNEPDNYMMFELTDGTEVNSPIEQVPHPDDADLAYATAYAPENALYLRDVVYRARVTGTWVPIDVHKFIVDGVVIVDDMHFVKLEFEDNNIDLKYFKIGDTVQYSHSNYHFGDWAVNTVATSQTHGSITPLGGNDTDYKNMFNGKSTISPRPTVGNGGNTYNNTYVTFTLPDTDQIYNLKKIEAFVLARGAEKNSSNGNAKVRTMVYSTARNISGTRAGVTEMVLDDHRDLNGVFTNALNKELDKANPTNETKYRWRGFDPEAFETRDSMGQLEFNMRSGVTSGSGYVWDHGPSGIRYMQKDNKVRLFVDNQFIDDTPKDPVKILRMDYDNNIMYVDGGDWLGLDGSQSNSSADYEEYVTNQPYSGQGVFKEYVEDSGKAFIHFHSSNREFIGPNSAEGTDYSGSSSIPFYVANLALPGHPIEPPSVGALDPSIFTPVTIPPNNITDYVNPADLENEYHRCRLTSNELNDKSVYYSRVKYIDASGTESDFSPWHVMGVKDDFSLDPGDAVYGGYYVTTVDGQGSTTNGLDDAGERYHLILCPGRGGVNNNLLGRGEYNYNSSNQAGPDLFNNETFGGIITNYILNDQERTDLHPAFKWLTSTYGPNGGNYDLTVLPPGGYGTGIGQHNDWYIPAKEELLHVANMFKSLELDDFDNNYDLIGDVESYLSATQDVTNYARYRYVRMNAYSNLQNKSVVAHTLAVRRVKV